jgi:YbbR domain-containing protein
MRVVRFIIHNWPLKIGAVVLAVILYVAMVALQSTQQWPGTIPIDLINQPTTGVLMKPLVPQVVTNIRYIAAPDVPVTRDSFRATVDLTNVKVVEGQDFLAKVQLLVTDPRIQIIDYQPQQLTVALDPIDHRQVGVQVDYGVVPSGLQPGTPVLSAVTVDASGAASVVRQVAYAGAEVRIDASGLDVSQDVVLVAYDAKGAKLDGTVTFNPRTVHVDILVGSELRTETVAVNPVVAGAPASGYTVTSIDVSPAVVAVRGQADALAQLKNGLADTQSISISGATGDVTRTVALNLPTGVSAESSNQVTVTVHLQTQGATRSVSVGLVPDGARSDRIYSFSTPNVTVTLGGATAALNAFDTSQLVGIVSVANLNVGSSTVTITVNLPAGIKLVAISPSQVVVTVTNAPTPSPLASASPP